MDPDALARIVRTAVTARRFEERITTLALAGELPTTLHIGAGHEVAQAAALAALRDDDPMLYGHRGTAYWIARGIPLGTILCDLMGREGGTNRGKGGVMHVVDPTRGVLGESGTLGANFVIGCGVAYAERHFGRDSVTIVFFGDGTSNRGQFHEAANFAALERLPVIFFCENNGIGLSVAAGTSTSVADIADRAHGYGMASAVVDGGDAAAVFEATARAASHARAGDGPTLLEAKVVRIGGHWLGDHQKYRSVEDRAALERRDPLPPLLASIDADARAALERDVASEIDAAVEFMRRQPEVDPATAVESLYAP
jgi:acetoin:2,6-dichlorophenolindophenol oxidoreductase subunit alpha